MAFRFKTSNSDHKISASSSSSSLSDKKSTRTSNNNSQYKETGENINLENKPTVLPKLTNSQLNKLTKVFPVWLRDNNNPKQLPGIYQGVLGQVQLQPELIYSDDGKFNNNKTTSFGSNNQLVCPKVAPKGGFLSLRRENSQNQLDYMNRFTDTERVQQLLSTSQLPNETLAAIWAHVNKTFPGKLTNREVCLALSLIALFQRKQIAITAAEKNIDPFDQIKLEKKPPLPKLHPHQNQNNPNSTNKSDREQANFLLVDLQDNGDCTVGGDKVNSNHEQTADCKETTKSDLGEDLMNLNTPKKALFTGNRVRSLNRMNNSVSLIDMDGMRLEDSLCNLTEIWLKCLKSIRSIYKRSFDILNVENSRQSAIEALESNQGKMFSKQLSLCYPMAHNIRYKIMSLNNLKLDNSEAVDDSGEVKAKNDLFDKSYIIQIDDLMTSINEYWAVLINLFHESGLTKFIEFIMDGLNYNLKNGQTSSWEELAEELDVSYSKKEACSICLTKFYLVENECANTGELSDQDMSLLGDNKYLISIDDHYYYHARCANFWINNVVNSREVANFADNNNTLPFLKPICDNILSPDSPFPQI